MEVFLSTSEENCCWPAKLDLFIFFQGQWCCRAFKVLFTITLKKIKIKNNLKKALNKTVHCTGSFTLKRNLIYMKTVESPNHWLELPTFSSSFQVLCYCHFQTFIIQIRLSRIAWRDWFPPKKYILHHTRPCVQSKSTRVDGFLAWIGWFVCPFFFLTWCCCRLATECVLPTRWSHLPANLAFTQLTFLNCKETEGGGRRRWGGGKEYQKNRRSSPARRHEAQISGAPRNYSAEGGRRRSVFDAARQRSDSWRLSPLTSSQSPLFGRRRSRKLAAT